MQPQALIRTYVPILVGSLISWLAAHGINVDAAGQTALSVGFTGVFIAAYYTIAHLLESRWPVFSLLLGSTAKPSYDQKAVPAGSLTLAKSETDEAPDALE